MTRLLGEGSRSLAVAASVLLVGLQLGCDRSPQPEASPTRQLGQAAALVGADTVSLDEVRALVDASGLSPRAALERLVAERLLSQYAEERGYGALHTVQKGVEQARVQALLVHEIEAPGSPGGEQPRRDKLDQLLRELKQKQPVRYDEVAIQKAFSPAGE